MKRTLWISILYGAFVSYAAEVLVVHDAGVPYYRSDDVGNALASLEDPGGFALVLTEDIGRADGYSCAIQVSVSGSCYLTMGSFKASIDVIKPVAINTIAFGTSRFHGRSARYDCISRGRRAALERAVGIYGDSLLRTLQSECAPSRPK